MKRLYLLAAGLLLVVPFRTQASDQAETKSNNFYSFSRQERKPGAELEARTSDSFRQHPDYGVLPFASPCADCYEDLSQRKADYRYFVGEGSNGTHFYKQQSLGAINYQDASGHWREINPYLENTGSAGVFKAPHQPHPVSVDLNNRLTTITRGNYTLEFNKSLELYHLAPDGSITPFGSGDWSNYSAGDDGVKITNVYPGIDLEIIAGEGRVKANFILNTNPGFSSGWIVMKQGLSLPSGLKLETSLARKDADGKLSGSIPILEPSGEMIFEIAGSYVFAGNAETGQHMNVSAEVMNDELHVFVPVSWLNDASRIYPVTIDPLFTATGNLAQAGISGSGGNDSCFSGITGGCIYTMLPVAVPINCTITDIKTTFTYTAAGSCVLKDGGFRIKNTTCVAPAPVFAFTNPSSLPGSAGVNMSVLTAFSACVLPPQCASYNMDFTLEFIRCNVDTNLGCLSNCISAGSAWVMIIEGHTVEISSITPAHIMCTGGNTTLTASASYGVGPYSFVWNPGALPGASVSVSPAGSLTYTCTVTDACLNSATSTCAVTVTASSAASVTLSPSGVVCGGNSVTFIATPNNGGPAPTFTFYVNGIPVQGPGPVATYMISPAATGDSISVEMTSNSPCASSPGPYQAWVVTQPTTNTSVTLTPSAVAPFCQGQTVTLTANPTGGGPAPIFGWSINNVVVAWTTSNIYTYTIPPGPAKTIRVILVSSLGCVTNDSVISLGRTFVGAAAATPSVSISPNPVDACLGANILFTATASNAGAAPTFQWQLNGTDLAGETNSTYTNSGTLGVGSYTVSVICTSNATCYTVLYDTATVSVTINPVSPAAVTISQNPAIFCAGDPVTFTANPTNGGLLPTYQWQLNGIDVVGETAVTFTTSAVVAAGTTVSVTLNSSSLCAVPNTATAGPIPVSFTTADTPSVVITPTPDPPVNLCANTNVTFNTTANGTGASPTFQWFVNGAPVGGNTGSYSQLFNATSLVTVIMTSSSTCVTQASDTDSVNVTITIPLIPSVTITPAPAGPICAGQTVTFTPTPVNGGAPVYDWYVNGILVFTGPTYSSNTLVNGDIVSVTMTASGCVSPTTATDQVVMTVNPATPPTINLTQSPVAPPPCPGVAITFTAQTTNGGVVPTFLWWVNGIPVSPSPNDSTFSSMTLVAGDLVKVTLHSTINCPGPVDSAIATLNAIVAPLVVPTVTSITQVPSGANCLGTALTFTANITGGGTLPTFQWLVNNVVVAGQTASTFTTSTLAIGDNVSVIMTSNEPCANPTTGTNNVNPVITPNLIPVVGIVAPANNEVCQNAQATFTANPVANGGTAPTYQWLVNGAPAGAGLPFNISTLANGDIVSVVMTSNDPCAAPLNDTDAVTMTVIPNVVPTITLTVAPDDSICENANATFTTVITNGGNNPQYQWYNNGAPIGGATADNYSSMSLANGDVISVILTSDALCAVPPTDTDQVTMTVTLNVPSVTIAAVPSGSICDGTSVTFTATPVNGGTTPGYQWQVNGGTVGTGPSYTSLTLVNGDQVTAILTSNAYCASPQVVTSNVFIANVVLYQTPTVTITSNPAGTICVGNPVTFTAVTTYGGPAPVFQWQVNGINVGTNSSTFVTSTLVDDDIVQVTLTSNYQCVTTPTAVSNTITIDAALPLQVTISGFTGTVCPGVPVVLTANATGGLRPYGYAWTQNAGTDSAATVAPQVTTPYAVAVSDVCGSTIARDTVLVDVYPSPAANYSYSPQNPSTLAPEVQFTDLSFQAVNWLWSFGDSTTDNSQNPKHVYNSHGHFQVELVVENGFGCLDSVTYTIFVKDEVAMYVPNSFTPDGDGLNDWFGPMGFNLGTYKMLIFDKWGSLIFEGNEYTPWDGRKKDSKEIAQMGVYVYHIYFDDGKYTEPVVVGRVTIAK